MSDTVNRQILLVEKPTGKLGPEHFKLTKGTMPEPKDGEALVRTRYISLDAANRAWMHGRDLSRSGRRGRGDGGRLDLGSRREQGAQFLERRSRVRRHRLAGICVVPAKNLSKCRT